MSAEKIVKTVREAVAQARSKAGMVSAHGQDVLQTGAHTLQEAGSVVAAGGRQARKVLTETRAELKRTLKDGATQIGDKLMRIATPTRKEEATAKKAGVKAKKQRRRDAEPESPESTTA